MGSVVLGIRVILAGVFAVAGVAKLADRPGTRQSLAAFGVPLRAVPIGAILLPLAELATAVALIPVPSARWGALSALVLMLAFMGGIANAMRQGSAPDCHCFGQLHSAPAGRSTLARNGVLAALAAVVIVEGPGPSVGDWVSARTAAELVAVGAVAAALFAAAFAVQLWRDRREARAALAETREMLAALPPGLPIGATAPSFSLPDLDGRTHTLESLRADGQPLVLVFVAPGCGPCQEMYPELGRWQAALSGRVKVALISGGDEALNRPAAEEHGLENVLLQDGGEVAHAYGVQATPSAVAVTPDGAIGSSAVSAIWMIEPLIRLALRRGPTAEDAAPVSAGAKPPLA